MRAERFAVAGRWISWACCLAMIAAVLLLWVGADAWWPATVFAFGPRWAIFPPLVLALPVVLMSGRRAILPLIVAAVIAIGPVMGFCVPWRVLSNVDRHGNFQLRVVSCNYGTGSDANGLQRFLEQVRPDLVVLQEYDNSPVPTDATGLRHVARYGQLVVASRFPIVDSEPMISTRIAFWRVPAVRFEVRTDAGPISVVCVHLETPRDGMEAVRYSWWRGASAVDAGTVRRKLEAELVREFIGRISGPVIVAGDFNTPVESAIYREHWSSFKNAFSRAGFGVGWTKYTRWFGVRIDHILVNSHWGVDDVWVGSNVGSDHRPVVADVKLLDSLRI